MLACLVNTCWVYVLQVSNDPKGHITLRDTWFEVFGSKIPFLSVLDCPNSPRRAITRHGELDLRMGGPARPQLATASNHSPPQWNHSPRRVRQWESHCFARFRQAWGLAMRFSPWCLFTNVNPSNQGPKWWSKKAWFLWYEASIKHVSKAWHTIETSYEPGSKYPLSKGKLEPRHSCRELAS
jgi:hypothetical protein